MLISVIKTRSFGIWPLKSAFTLIHTHTHTHTHNIIWWKKICDGNSALLHFCTKRNIVILDFVICTFVIVCVHCSHYRWLQIQAKKSHVKVSNRWIRYWLNLRLAWELIAFFDQVSVWLKLGWLHADSCATKPSWSEGRPSLFYLSTFPICLKKLSNTCTLYSFSILFTCFLFIYFI